MACLPVAGVYEIRNTLNNKVYIGSSINVNKRLTAARKGVKPTDAARKNMSLARTGMVQSRAAKENKGKMDYARVADLRRLAAEGVGPHTKLAEMFGVSRGRVSAILRGESWT